MTGVCIAQAPFVCHDARAVATYDYQCRACGTVTEVIHSMLDDGPSVCELCGGALRRIIFPSGIIFKGSGFYRNDSRSSRPGSADGGARVVDSEKGGGTEKAAPAEKGGSTGGTESSASSTTAESKPSGSTTKSTDGGST